jgi:hypothetical protein
MLIKIDKSKTMMNVVNNPNQKTSMFNDVIVSRHKRTLRWGTQAMTTTSFTNSSQSNNIEPEVSEPTPTIFTDGLVYYIDSGDSRSYAGSGSTLVDITPYFNTSKSEAYGTATIVNSPTTISDEYVGTYLSFDGNGQYIIGANMIDSFLNPVNENLTIESWVRTISNSEGVIATEQGSEPDGTTLNQEWHTSVQEIVGDTLYQGAWGFQSPIPDPTIYSVAGHTVMPNVWQHYALTYDASTFVLKSYVNGKLVAQRSSLQRQSPMDQGLNTYFYALMAADPTNMGDGTDLEGDWASFRVYNQTLTQTEISQNYISDASNRFGFEYPPADLSIDVSMNGLTSTTTVSNEIYGNGTYITNVSSSHNDFIYGYQAFNKNIASDDYWHSNTDYNSTTGVYEGTKSLAGIQGEWITIELPNTITLKEFVIYPRYSTPVRVQDRSPQKFTLLGSTNGTNWSEIQSYENLSWDPNVNNGVKRFDLQNNTTKYSHYGIVAEIIGNSDVSTGRDSLQICEWILVGV